MIPRRNTFFASIGLIGIMGATASAQSKPIWIVGGEEDVVTELTDFNSVLVTSRRIIVLENSAPFLKVLSLDGKLVQTLGGRGAGPGEFKAPYYMWYDSLANRLFVTDVSNMRLTAYSIGDTLSKPETTPFDNPWLYNVCKVNDRLFGLLKNETLAGRLTIDGGRLSTVSRFGEQRTSHPLASHPGLRHRASDGPILCDAARGRLVIGSSLLGELHILSTTTRAQQLMAVPGFKIMKVTAEGSSIVFHYGASWEVLRDIVRMGNQILAVVEMRTDNKTDPPVEGAYRYFAIEESGALSAYGTHKWRPVAIKEGRAICATIYPAPTVAAFVGNLCP